MNDPKDKKENKEEIEDRLKYRVSITHRNVKEIEAACSTIVNQATEKNEAQEDSVRVRGPMRMPTKVLRITTRKAPCGNGKSQSFRFFSSKNFSKKYFFSGCSMYFLS